MSVAYRVILCLSMCSVMQAAEPALLQPYHYECQGLPVQAELGHLSVPERHSVPAGPKIRLAFLRLKTTSSRPGPPIFYLAGGPGGSGIALAKGPRGSLFLKMRQVGDVIVLDQRGVGLSEPNLECPGLFGFPLTAPGDRLPLLDRFKEASRTCAAFWRERAVDLAAYNVVENAHDVDSLRQALGAEKVILWGSSYGTHLALAIIRHHGQGVFRAVLSGVEGPDHTLKMPRTVDEQLATINALLAAEPKLAKLVPDLASLISRVLVAAERIPFNIAVKDTESGHRITVVLGRFDIAQLVVGMMSTREGIVKLPRTLLALDQRQLSSPLIQKLAQDVIRSRTGSIGSAMSYAMDCASYASKERMSRIARETETATVGHLDLPIPDVCPAWNVPPLPAQERTLVRSPVPVLFLSGTLDARTPPQNVEEVQKGFPNSRHVLIIGAGHGNDLFISSPKIFQVTLEFMKTGRVSVSRIDLPALRFQ